MESLLSVELKASSFRIVREKDEKTGNILLAEKKLRTGSAGFLGRVATKITFSPVNGQNFVATVEENIEAIVSEESAKDPLAANLLLEHTASHPKVVSCECGSTYPVFAVRCDLCKRSDPLGNRLAKKGRAFQKKFTKQLASALKVSASLPGLLAIKSALDRSVDAFEDTAARPTEDDDRKVALKKMLDYHKRIFQLECFSAGDIATLKAQLGGCGANIIETLMRTADEARTKWKDSPSAGWKSSTNFSNLLTATLQHVWSEPLRLARKSALDLVQCAAAFNKFAVKWQEELEHEFDLWDAAKWAWRGFRAYITFGVSELIKLGVGLLKNSRDQKAWEQFATKLDSAIQTAKSATQMIEHAFREQDKVALQLAENLYRHLLDILVADYAALPGVDRHAFVVRLDQVFGKPRAPKRSLVRLLLGHLRIRQPANPF